MKASRGFSGGKALLLLIVGVTAWAGSGVWRTVQSGHELCSQPTADLRPRRIVSLALVTDEILVHLVSKDRIAALHPISADPTFSNIADQVAKIPKIQPDTEVILRLRPDLVLAASFNGPHLLGNLRRLGCQVVVMSRFDSFESIRENVLLIARAVGEEARGHALLKEMDEKLETIAPLGARGDPPPQVLFIGPSGFTAGRGTTVSEVIRLAGGHNVAGGILKGIGRLSPEVLLKLKPDVLLRTSYAPLDPATKWLFSLQAQMGGGDPREVVIDAKRLLSVSPYLASAVEELGVALKKEEMR